MPQKKISNMCKYCKCTDKITIYFKGAKRLIDSEVFLKEIPPIQVQIMNNNMLVLSSEKELIRARKINYCPMCREKVGGA